VSLLPRRYFNREQGAGSREQGSRGLGVREYPKKVNFANLPNLEA
jgi:hypothetical protein